MIINQYNIYMRSLGSYVDQLCANKPIPGGGSVAGLVGALGQGLVLMVSNFTSGKKKYEDIQPIVDEAIKLGKNYLDKFKKLSMDDMAAYDKVSYAYIMAKDDFVDLSAKKIDINLALQEAMLIPIAVIDECEKAMDLLEKIYDKFNKNLLTDFGVACKMFESAAYSSYLNVVINEKSLNKDGDLFCSKKALEKCEKIKKQSDKIYNYVVGYLLK